MLEQKTRDQMKEQKLAIKCFIAWIKLKTVNKKSTIDKVQLTGSKTITYW